jgi:hypothetical protein
MRPGEFDRERDTASLPAVDAMLSRPPVMSPINEVLRARIRSIRPQMHDCGTPMEVAHGA